MILTLVCSPVIWAMIAQLFTGAVTLPLYLAFTYNSTSSSEPLPSNYPLAVFLGTLLGGGIPTVAMFLPQFFTADQHQIIIAIWQLLPIWMSLATKFFELVLPKREAFPKAWTPKALSRAIFALYAFVGLMVHQWACMIAMLDPKASFKSVFVPSPLESPTVSNGFKMIFQFDYIFISLAGLLWTALVVGRHAGSGGFVLTFLKLVALALVVSPQTAVGLGMWWREGKKDEKEKKKE
jgi:hypothetical protein